MYCCIIGVWTGLTLALILVFILLIFSAWRRYMLASRSREVDVGRHPAAAMKIVHVETGRHFYGGAQQVVWLATGLATEGIEGILVCPAESAVDRVARSAGIRVENIECAGDHDLGFAWRLRSFLKREKPDLVHCHSRRGGDFFGGLASRLAGIPAVVSRRVDSEESAVLARLRGRLFRRTVAISEHIAALLEKSAKDTGKIVVIRSAVDAGQFVGAADCARFRQEFQIDDGDLTIAVVAQLIRRKGHRFLFDVIPNLRDLYPGIRIVLFGSGAEEENLRALAAQLNLGGTVYFAGFRDDLDSYMQCFDLLVHPATEEGLGVAMLKAAAAGVPVVAFDVAGSREAVVHGKTGVLVETGDVRVLQKAIALLIEEPEMRQDFGAAGRQRMLDEFSVEQMVRSHVDLYQSVLREIP